MKKMTAVMVSMVALACVVAGCDSHDAKPAPASNDLQKNARDYADKNQPNYGSGKQLFDPDSVLKKKDEAKK